MDHYPSKSTVPEERVTRIRLLGTGAAAPTIEVGQQITATLSATGVVKLTWAEHPGLFVGASYMFGAATPADVKGRTCTRDTPDTTAGVFSMEFSIWNSGFAADNLQATEFLDLTLVFSGTSEI